jgi:hypothetical protein
MRHKKLKWSAVIWLCLGLAGLQAQNTMFVNERSGTQTPYAFTSINKLTFASDNMTVNKKDGSTSIYALTDIRYLNFGITTAIAEISGEKGNDILLFPSPVKDQLHIRYESKTTGNVQLQILNVQGKFIYQQTLCSLYGTNYLTIPVTKLEHGMYMCRLQNGSKIETAKFIKY